MIDFMKFAFISLVRGYPAINEGNDMNQELDKAIYYALRKYEATSGVGSSPTANEVMKVVKPYYKNGTSEDKKEILAVIEKLRKEPGIPFPTNIEDLLNS